MFVCCIVTSFVFIFKGFHSILQALYIFHEFMISVKRYWRFYFLLLLDISYVVPTLHDVLKFVYTRCGKQRTCQILVFWLRITLWKPMRSGRSILLLFCDSSRLRKLHSNLSLSKKPNQIRLRAKSPPKPHRPLKTSGPSAPHISSKDFLPPRRSRSIDSFVADLNH